jgi:hypothetical protein
MFSGGEKKSFYELSFVIGTSIIALKLKSTHLVHSKYFNFLLPLFFTIKSVRSSIFSSCEDISSL